MPKRKQAGNIALRWLAGMAIVAFLVAITIPMSAHTRDLLQRRQTIEGLAMINAAKIDAALRLSLARGTAVTPEQLLKDSRIMPAWPAFPPGIDVEVGPVGEKPTAVFNGEKLNPYIDYGRIRVNELI